MKFVLWTPFLLLTSHFLSYTLHTFLWKKCIEIFIIIICIWNGLLSNATQSTLMWLFSSYFLFVHFLLLLFVCILLSVWNNKGVLYSVPERINKLRSTISILVILEITTWRKNKNKLQQMKNLDLVRRGSCITAYKYFLFIFALFYFFCQFFYFCLFLFELIAI